LNKADFDNSWSNSVNQAGLLAERAGFLYWAEERDLDFRVLVWKRRFGNTVLSRYPISNVAIVDLPGYSKWEIVLTGKKYAIRCDIRLGDHQVRILGVHLSHRSERLSAFKRPRYLPI